MRFMQTDRFRSHEQKKRGVEGTDSFVPPIVTGTLPWLHSHTYRLWQAPSDTLAALQASVKESHGLFGRRLGAVVVVLTCSLVGIIVSLLTSLVTLI